MGRQKMQTKVHLDRLQVSSDCVHPGRGISLPCDHFFGRIFFFNVTILQVFIELVTILLLFHVLVFLAIRHVGS